MEAGQDLEVNVAAAGLNTSESECVKIQKERLDSMMNVTTNRAKNLSTLSTYRTRDSLLIGSSIEIPQWTAKQMAHTLYQIKPLLKLQTICEGIHDCLKIITIQKNDPIL